MRIVLLGSGNVATVLGRLFISSGHSIEQVYSRNMDHASILASEFKAPFTNDLSNLEPGADLYLAAVSDTALYAIADSLHLKKGLLLHTAGSVPMQVLENSAANHGGVIPASILTKGNEQHACHSLLHRSEYS